MTAPAQDRPFPPPATPWTLFMRWTDLAFLHWPVAPERLRPLVPEGLELETFDGSAWVGVVPFRMEGIRHRRLPAVPGARAFPELNVRTYVRRGGVPGVYFFSLDAAHRAAVRVARRTFHLPYYDARMSCETSGDGTIAYRSIRTHRGAPRVEFEATYGPVAGSIAATPQPGTLEFFLTARYCLYSHARDGRIFRGHIDHLPWPLQLGRCSIRTNTMAEPISVRLEGPPLVHFSARLDVVAWAITPA